MNDDIYLADQDGAHPRKMADGVPWATQAGARRMCSGTADPPGRRTGVTCSSSTSRAWRSAQLTGHIADASGHVVASIPNIWVDATWSPDSTRIEAWTGGSEGIGTTQISIFGIDGALQESLALTYGLRAGARVTWLLGARRPIGVRPSRPRGCANRLLAVADRWVGAAPARPGRPAIEREGSTFTHDGVDSPF